MAFIVLSIMDQIYFRLIKKFLGPSDEEYTHQLGESVEIGDYIVKRTTDEVEVYSIKNKNYVALVAELSDIVNNCPHELKRKVTVSVSVHFDPIFVTTLPMDNPVARKRTPQKIKESDILRTTRYEGDENILYGFEDSDMSSAWFSCFWLPDSRQEGQGVCRLDNLALDGVRLKYTYLGQNNICFWEIHKSIINNVFKKNIKRKN